MAESREEKLKETDHVSMDLLNLVAGHMFPQHLQTIGLGLGLRLAEIDQIEYDFPTNMARCSTRRNFQVHSCLSVHGNVASILCRISFALNNRN